MTKEKESIYTDGRKWERGDGFGGRNAVEILLILWMKAEKFGKTPNMQDFRRTFGMDGLPGEGKGYGKQEETELVSFTYEIKDELGLHARPAGLLVKEAGRMSSSVTIVKDGRFGDAKKIFSVMGLGVKKRDRITVKLEGEREEEEARELKAFFEENL